MCHPIIGEYVKGKALHRREVFLTSAAAGASLVAATTLSPATALANTTPRVVDLTYTLTPDFPTYFGDQAYFEEEIFSFAQSEMNGKRLRFDEHAGTHIDAPLQFSDGGASIDEVPVASLVCPLVTIDIREKADVSPDAQVTPEDVRAWVAENGPIPPGACVAQNAGWQRRMGTPGFRNQDDAGKLHFPGFHPETALMLMEDAEVVGLGVDTLSIDHGPSSDFAAHYAWLPSNRWAVENMANLDQLPATGATLVVGAPKHAGGTGGQCRLLALM